MSNMCFYKFIVIYQIIMTSFYDFKYFQNFLTVEEADKAYEKLKSEISYVDKKLLIFKIFGKEFELPRDKGFYGDQVVIVGKKATPLYRYGGDYYPPVLPWTPTLEKMRDLIYEKTGQRCNHVVVNRYKNGKNHIGFHKDKTRDFEEGSGVLTVSFGATRKLDVKEDKKEGSKRRKVSVDLGHGSLFVLGSVTNENSKHSIRKTSSPVGERMSLTFRSIKTFSLEDGTVVEKPVCKKRKFDDVQ